MKSIPIIELDEPEPGVLLLDRSQYQYGSAARAKGEARKEGTTAATATAKRECPICHASSWDVLEAPTHAWRCRCCHSHLVPRQGTVAIAQHIGVEVGMLPGLVEASGRTSKLACPRGHGPLNRVPLKGTETRMCMTCAVSVFYPGQLEALLEGGARPPAVMSGANPVAPSDPEEELPLLDDAAAHFAEPVYDVVEPAHDAAEVSSSFDGKFPTIGERWESWGLPRVTLHGLPVKTILTVLVTTFVIGYRLYGFASWASAIGSTEDVANDYAVRSTILGEANSETYDASAGLQGAVHKLPVFLPAKVVGRYELKVVNLSTDGVEHTGYVWALATNEGIKAVDAFYDDAAPMFSEVTIVGSDDIEYEYELDDGTKITIEMSKGARGYTITELVPVSKKD